MKAIRRALAILAGGIIVLAAPVVAAADVPAHFLGDKLVRVHLATESAAVGTGRTTALAVEFVPAPGWHIYWRNPGDSGRAPQIVWRLPRDASIGALSWPPPERLTTAGITTYVYNRPATLLASLTFGGAVRPAHDVVIAADISWLVCSNVCVPGHTRASTRLTIVENRPAIESSGETRFFAAARARLPIPAPYEATFSSDRDSFFISLPIATFGQQNVTNASFFPFDSTLIAQSAPQSVTIDDRVTVTVPRIVPQAVAPAHIDGVLAVDAIDADGHHVRSDYEIRASSTAATQRPLSFIVALVLALLGGLVLNVMPCVFPVLSFKALGALEGDIHRRWRGALAYAAGTVASCSMLGVALLVLRGGGAAVGWGFQWQSPLFVALLALLLLALALSMSGVAEIVLPLPAYAARFGNRDAVIRSFIDGTLVALIASSCTAPFMGAALGFAGTAPAPIAFGIFVALGLGLALPYVVVTSIPAVAARLPKPGAWMIVALRLFAFPLYASVAWLVWVFSAQVDPNALLALLVALVFVGFAVSAFGNAQLGEGGRTGWRLLGVAALVIALALVAPTRTERRAASPSASSIHFERFTLKRLAALRSTERPVFVDITAAWCITCQVNDRLALERSDVADRFRQLHVALLQGDWTNQDAEISVYLQQFGRSGIPLYVLYRAGNVEVLPQLLTPGIVLDRLKSHVGGPS
ncbi:MAG TPA: thioredoxin family protein [Candidatus Baltobacteraceae bacterium]